MVAAAEDASATNKHMAAADRGILGKAEACAHREGCVLVWARSVVGETRHVAFWLNHNAPNDIVGVGYSFNPFWALTVLKRKT